MSEYGLYDGKIRREDTSPKGESIKKQNELFCKVEKVYGPLERLDVTTRQVNKMSGSVTAKPSFHGFFEKLTTRYTFLDAAVRFVMQKFIHLINAPAEEIKARRVMKPSKNAQGMSHPADEALASNSFKTSISAHLVSYFRAPVVFLRKLFLPSKALLIFGEAVEAGYKRGISTALESSMEKSVGTIVKSENNRIACDDSASAISAATDSTAVERAFEAAHVANGESAAVIDTKANVLPAVEYYARLIAWGNAVVDGVLIIRNAYEATQDGELLFMGTVPETWDEPYYDESGALVIGQVRLTAQNKEMLGVI